MSDVLRGRYRTLLRWYPDGYVAERGDEIVDTYLDLAAPGQRWPHPRDVADLALGGVRQQLRARGALGLADALPVAAQLAMVTAAGLAALWLVIAEHVFTWAEDPPWDPAVASAGLGAVVWMLWVLVPVAALLGHGRPAVVVALLATAAVVPLGALLPYARPTLFVLVPQLALGLFALGVPSRRRSPIAATGVVVTGAVVWLAYLSDVHDFYVLRLGALPYAGLLLAMATVVAGAVFSVRGDPRGWWPVLILIGPVLLLLIISLTTAGSQQAWPSGRQGALTTAFAVMVAVAAVPAALWLRRRVRPTDRCPTCGRAGTAPAPTPVSEASSEHTG